MMEYPAKQGRNHFLNITWPGYSGVVTGMVPGQFSVAMNACWCEAVGVGVAPTMLLRKVLEQGRSYNHAVKLLSETQMFAGALFTVVGCRSGEKVIIEREPLRYAHRTGDCVITTNDYVALNPKTVQPSGSEILATSCGRYQAVQEYFAGEDADTSTYSCLELLRSERVKMSCTVQHVVMQPAHGKIIAVRSREEQGGMP